MKISCIATLCLPAWIADKSTQWKGFTHVLFQLNKDLFALDDIEGNSPGLDAAILECGVDEAASIRSCHSNISEEKNSIKILLATTLPNRYTVNMNKSRPSFNGVQWLAKLTDRKYNRVPVELQ